MLDILGPMVYDLLPPFLLHGGSEAGYGPLGGVSEERRHTLRGRPERRSRSSMMTSNTTTHQHYLFLF
ncbi:unnamed protein product [Heterosigma akashiwo]